MNKDDIKAFIYEVFQQVRSGIVEFNKENPKVFVSMPEYIDFDLAVDDHRIRFRVLLERIPLGIEHEVDSLYLSLSLALTHSAF